MAKLRDLVSCLAKELDIPSKSMNVLAMEVRKAGLIQTAGRGLNSAEMGPSDAANLILAALSGSYATQSAEAVRILRAGTSLKCLTNGEEAEPPAIPVYQRLRWPHTLGEFLDGYIEDQTTQEDIRPHDYRANYMFFTLARYSLGWHASVSIAVEERSSWQITYECNRPEHKIFSEVKMDTATRHILNKQGSGRRTVSETVAGDLFVDAARCIKDQYSELFEVEDE